MYFCSLKFPTSAQFNDVWYIFVNIFVIKCNGNREIFRIEYVSDSRFFHASNFLKLGLGRQFSSEWYIFGILRQKSAGYL